jgi:hypothetical protein
MGDSRSVWKYPLSSFPAIILVPKGAKILKLAIQDNFPTLWILVNPEENVEERIFDYYGTGFTINNIDHKVYIDTWFNGPFVWHLFEVTDIKK